MKVMFLIPSAYGLLTFPLAFALYKLNLIGYVHTSSDADVLCIYAIAAFACATVISFEPYKLVARSFSGTDVDVGRASARLKTLLLVLHAIGLFGIYKYVQGLVAYFGSTAELLANFADSSYKIRWAQDDVQSIGTQLSYFGWIAIWLTFFGFGRRALKSVYWLPVAVQILANMVYIDRTRPVWILFSGGLIFLAARYHSLSAAKLVRTLSISGVALVLVFVLVGAWIGKISLSGERSTSHSVLPLALEPVYLYGTGGFAYLDQLVATEQPSGGIPERILYPVFMLTSRFGMTTPPPPQILEFKDIPMPTNVGTFLEPLYRDAGALGVALGVLLIIFGGNVFALYLLRTQDPIALVAWATICFADFIAFFTPKASMTPTWLFLVAGFFFACGAVRRNFTGVSKPFSGS